MRLPSKAQSTDALECLQEEAKRRWTAKNLPFGAERLVAAGSAVLGALGKANLKKSDDEEIGEGAVETLLSLFLNITKPEEFIKAFVAATMAAEKVPVMIVDEAWEWQKRSSLQSARNLCGADKGAGESVCYSGCLWLWFPIGTTSSWLQQVWCPQYDCSSGGWREAYAFFAARVGFVSRLGTGAMSNFAQCFSKPCFC